MIPFEFQKIFKVIFGEIFAALFEHIIQCRSRSDTQRLPETDVFIAQKAVETVELVEFWCGLKGLSRCLNSLNLFLKPLNSGTRVLCIRMCAASR